MTIRDIATAQPSVFPRTWSQLDDRTRLILDGYGGEPVIAVRPSLVQLLRGNANAALLLSQLLYWSRRLGDLEGWFFQTQPRLAAQTGLGAHAQSKAVKLLVRIGVLETRRRGVPAKLYYRLNLQQLAALLVAHDQRASVSEYGAKLDVPYGRTLDTDHGPPLVASYGPQHKKITYQNNEEICSPAAPIADAALPLCATHGPTESPIEGSSQTMSSIPIPEPASLGTTASTATAEPPQAAAFAASEPVTGAPHRRPTGPRGPALPRRPATLVPDNFVVTAAMHAWARDRVPWVHVARETEKFLNHAHANDRRQVDWPAAWRNWMLKAQEFAEHDQRPAARGGVVL